MSDDASSATGKRWFHTLVVVGASLTGGAACGSGKSLVAPDAAHVSDGSSDGADAVADTRGNSDAGDNSASDRAADAGAEGGADAIADAPAEFPMVLIP
jgi:hypothetical protein